MSNLYFNIRFTSRSLFKAITLTSLCFSPAHAFNLQFDEVAANSGERISVSRSITITSDTDTSDSISSDSISSGSKSQSLDFFELYRTGDKDQGNNEVYGLMKDHTGAPALSAKGEPYICSGNTPGVIGSGTDFSALLDNKGKTYLVSQFECPTGGMYYAEMERKNGKLMPVPGTLKSIDQSREWGGWVHCAGSVTPWNSYLGGEEYEPDANNIENNKSSDKKYNDKVRSYWLGNDELSSPYHNGWITEVDIDPQGEARFKKHYAMGRFSHELGYVMPDERTVYLTDDGVNNVLFMFVSEIPGDLSSGTLYAAKWNQTSGYGGGSAQLEWISLGLTSNSEIRKQIEARITFSKMFAQNTEGCTLIAADGVKECLELKPGMHKLASRLESRRYAAMMGATHEFRKMEGFTFSQARNQGYIAVSEVGCGMLNNQNDPAKLKAAKPKAVNHDDLDNDGFSETGNHIRVLKADYCGAIYSMDMNENVQDNSNNIIDSQYVAVNMHSILASGTKLGEVSAKKCAATQNDIMAQPDNISMIQDSNILIIGEDGKHANNMIWAFDLDTRGLTRIATVPEGAETTSPYLHKVGDDYYMSLVAQHPDASSDNAKGDSITGLIGPIKLDKN